MFKIPITTQKDFDEATKLHKREIFEEERKKRIFNAKQRLLGLDLETLQQQISEKNKQRQVEIECNRRYEDQAKIQQHLLHSKQLEMEKRQRVLESDLNYYRCRFQRKNQRREFDLNDPEWLKKAQPARIADNDPTLGISSAQVFSGEDLGNRERTIRQRTQQRAWLDQQVLERKQAEESRLKADRVMEESLFACEKRLEEMAQSERSVKNQITDSINRYNAELVQARKVQRMVDKRNKDEDDMAEIYNMLSSDMLSENPDVAQSHLNPNKKIAFMYRGMTPEELKKLRDDQHRQKLENEKVKTNNELIEKQWENYALNMDRELMLKQCEIDRKQKEAIKEQVEYNVKLAAEQKSRKEHFDKVMSVNYMAKEFYDQFNKTSR